MLLLLLVLLLLVFGRAGSSFEDRRFVNGSSREQRRQL